MEASLQYVGRSRNEAISNNTKTTKFNEVASIVLKIATSIFSKIQIIKRKMLRCEISYAEYRVGQLSTCHALLREMADSFAG